MSTLSFMCRYWAIELKRWRQGRSARLWVPIVKCLQWKSLQQATISSIEVHLYNSVLVLSFLGSVVYHSGARFQVLRNSIVQHAYKRSVIRRLATMNILIRKMDLLGDPRPEWCKLANVYRESATVKRPTTTGAPHLRLVSFPDVHRLKDVRLAYCMYRSRQTGMLWLLTLPS